MKRITVAFFITIGVLLLISLMTSVALAGGHKEPTTGQNPHGNYSDSGDKCKVCHAVHNAASGGETLLRSTRADACVYCHVSNNFTIKRPYGTVSANYTTEYNWNHDNDHNGNTPPGLYAGCVSCHSVHGANTFGGASKILKNNPGKALATPVTNEIDFCRDCHNKTGQNLSDPGGCFYYCHGHANFGGPDQDPCTDCHNPTYKGRISSEYYLTSRNGVSHIMTTTKTGNSGNDVAWDTSETCRKCHMEGSNSDGDSFPHFTPNAVQFLDDGYTQQGTNLDQVCLNCHTDTGNGNNYNSGAGKTF